MSARPRPLPPVRSRIVGTHLVTQVFSRACMLHRPRPDAVRPVLEPLCGRVPAVHPNDHQTTFAIYAASQSWTAAHLGQFIGMVIITFGLVALFFALDVRSGVGIWLNRFALLSAGAAMALYGVLQAVDGVAVDVAPHPRIRLPRQLGRSARRRRDRRRRALWLSSRSPKGGVLPSWDPSRSAYASVIASELSTVQHLGT
jgi:hypothetical protein